MGPHAASAGSSADAPTFTTANSVSNAHRNTFVMPDYLVAPTASTISSA
jgi:hypothetical protein